MLNYHMKSTNKSYSFFTLIFMTIYTSVFLYICPFVHLSVTFLLVLKIQIISTNIPKLLVAGIIRCKILHIRWNCSMSFQNVDKNHSYQLHCLVSSERRNSVDCKSDQLLELQVQVSMVMEKSSGYLKIVTNSLGI